MHDEIACRLSTVNGFAISSTLCHTSALAREGTELAPVSVLRHRGFVVLTNRFATVVFAGLAVFALVFAAPALASQAAPQPKDPAPIMGDLVKVDTDKKVVTVKVADGTETEFQYNDSTEISGATKDAAGLATMKEGRVTVHFKEDAQTRSKLATRIIVQPKK